MRHDSELGPPWRDGESRRSRLVFIGRDLDRAELEAGFRACLLPAAEGPAEAEPVGAARA